MVDEYLKIRIVAFWACCIWRGSRSPVSFHLQEYVPCVPHNFFYTVCGIPDDKLVEAHGSFATASCHLCYTTYPAEEAKVCPALWSITIQIEYSESFIRCHSNASVVCLFHSMP